MPHRWDHWGTRPSEPGAHWYVLLVQQVFNKVNQLRFSPLSSRLAESRRRSDDDKPNWGLRERRLS